MQDQTRQQDKAWLDAVTRPSGLPLPRHPSLLQGFGLVPSQCPPQQLAGRTRYHVDNWKRVTQSIGTLHCRGIRTGIRESTIPVMSTSHQGARKSGSPNSRGGQCPCKEGSNHQNTKGRSQGRVLLNSVPSSKEKGEVPASYQLPSSEQVSSVPPLQDGRYSPALRPVTGRGLDVQNRPKECILFCPNSYLSPKIPEVHLERSNLPVYLPPIWPLNSTTHIHKVVETSGRQLSLPPEKMKQIKEEANNLLRQEEVSARALACFIGKLTAAIIYPAPLHYRGLQQLKHNALRRAGYDGTMPISQRAREDLKLWINNLTSWNGRNLSKPEPLMVLETDASNSGWGVFYQGEFTGGCWAPQKSQLHINALELLAAFFGLKVFAKHKRGISIQLLSDNQTVVSHLYRMGGTRSRPE